MRQLTIFLSLSLLFVVWGGLQAQVRYWDHSFKKVRSQRAVYYSLEEKQASNVLRSFYLLADSSLKKTVLIGKSRQTLKEEYYDDQARISRRLTYTNQGILQQEKHINAAGGIEVHRMYKSNGSLVRVVSYRPDGSVLMDTKEGSRGKLDEGTQYYANGKPKIKMQKGKAHWYDMDGEQMPNPQSLFNGKREYFYENAQMKASLQFPNKNESFSEASYWYPNGQLRTDSAKGIWTTYYENGQAAHVSDTTLPTGEKGKIRLDTNGVIRELIAYDEKENKFVFTYYYASGSLLSRGKFPSWDEPESWQYFKEDGTKAGEKKLTGQDFMNIFKYSEELNAWIGWEDSTSSPFYHGIPEIGLYFNIDRDPLPLNMWLIRHLIGYPELALKKRIQGSVVVRILVDEQGRAVEYRVINDAPPLLRAGVEPYMLHLEFNPPTLNGKPVSTWVNIPFNYKL